MKTPITPALLAALCAMFISACASGPQRPRYSEAKQTGVLVPKKDKGLVLVYWHPATGLQKFNIYANDKLLTDRMGLGDFYTYDAPPGPVRFSSTGGSGNLTQDAILGSVVGGPLGGLLTMGLSKKKGVPVVEVAPAETYYVEMGTTGWREKMTLVSKEAGEKGIKDCRWINPPGN